MLPIICSTNNPFDQLSVRPIFLRQIFRPPNNPFDQNSLTHTSVAISRSRVPDKNQMPDFPGKLLLPGVGNPPQQLVVSMRQMCNDCDLLFSYLYKTTL